VQNYLSGIFFNRLKSRFSVFACTAAILALFLPACGFHLRGAYEIPNELKNVYLQGESAELHQYFSRTLQSSSGQLAGSAEKAGVIVKVYNERMQRRVLSLSARGRANDFELDYRLEYELVRKGNDVLLPRQPLEVRREYFNDQQEIIAKDNEENVIRSEMYQQAVRTIINRAQAVLEARAK